MSNKKDIQSGQGLSSATPDIEPLTSLKRMLLLLSWYAGMVIQSLLRYMVEMKLQIPDVNHFVNSVRNIIMSIGAILGFSKLQWKSLVKGLISLPQAYQQQILKLNKQTI